MDVAVKTGTSPELFSDTKSPEEKVVEEVPPPNGSVVSPQDQQQNQQSVQQQQQQQKIKRKHRRGKPKAKNANKPYKKTNWKFQMPRLNYSKCGPGGGGGGGAGGNRREKLQRSRSLVPYNTNKFLMEDHLADVPNALHTPSGRTRDSSFSMDSEDNYFFSLPEDEEEFLTKEFANVYEKARLERLENLSKQDLIHECLQIEDRYSKDQGNQRQQQLNIQRIAAEYMAKIRVLEEKLRELSRENHNLRGQLMRSAAFAAAAAASPPSAAAPIGAACQPTPMDSSSEDSESDSSSSSSSSTSSSSSSDEGDQPRRRRSCSSRSSVSEYNGGDGGDDYVDKNYVMQNGAAADDNDEEVGNQLNELVSRDPRAHVRNDDDADDDDNVDYYERLQLLDDHMDDDDVGDGDDEAGADSPNLTNGYHPQQGLQPSSPRSLNRSPLAVDDDIANDAVSAGVVVNDDDELVAVIQGNNNELQQITPNPSASMP